MSRLSPRLLSVPLLSVLCLLLVACGDDPRLQQGAALYGEHCASCHGPNLEGEADWQTRKPDGRLPAPPHNAAGHTWHHSDQALFEMTKFGMAPPHAPEGYESDMPAFADVLTDDEIVMVIDYIKSRWSSRERMFQDSMTNPRP